MSKFSICLVATAMISLAPVMAEPAQAGKREACVEGGYGLGWKGGRPITTRPLASYGSFRLLQSSQRLSLVPQALRRSQRYLPLEQRERRIAQSGRWLRIAPEIRPGRFRGHAKLAFTEENGHGEWSCHRYRSPGAAFLPPQQPRAPSACFPSIWRLRGEALPSEPANRGDSPMGAIDDNAIRPSHINIPEEALDDLRRRIAATRWPTKELVEDRSQGVQLATLRELARYWTTEYDWRTCEARLNALPQFTTEIDGVEIHFIHVRSRHENALPLIMTHGWPGSVIELLETVGPLTDPTAHGGTPEDAFHLVLPSLPGYGFSGEPTELGWESGRIARAWAELMDRLGYTRYVAQGGDVGASVTDAMGRQAPEGLLGIHLNLLAGAIGHRRSTAGGIRAGTRGARRAQRRSRRTASATSWSSPPGRRRSATPCWIHPSGWRPGCSTTTRTATTRSPARSSTASPWAISPGTTSSTTSRCTG